MHIIEIAPLDNGAHRNQNGGINTVPEGWAVIPENMDIPETFPFVNIEVKNGIVTSMTAGEMPEPEPYEPEPVDEGDQPVTWNELATAYTEGVNSIG